MSLSKPIPLELLISLGQKYGQLLETRPILTKSITSGLIGAVGSLIAQYVGRPKEVDGETEWRLNGRSIFAFALFGFGVSGPLIHAFLNWLAKNGPKNPILKVILDRFVFGPFFLMLLLYLLPRFEGRSHKEATGQLRKLYRPALLMSWKIWIPVQLINLNFVPLQYRVLVTNLVSVGWNIYLSHRRALEQKKPKLEE